MRPRKVLVAAFPEGSVSDKEASEALRLHGGDLEKAKASIAAQLATKSTCSPTTSKCCTTHQDSKISDEKEGGYDERKLIVSRTGAETTERNISQTSRTGTTNQSQLLPAERLPPKTVASINNLSDRQYCCVWNVEVFPDGYRPDVARLLLARVAHHVNPILRERGWRVKRLIESCSRSWIGLCTTNGRGDADAASANIQLNLRTMPSKACKTFRSFESILSVMLHEITHISIGLEDIHPPAFFELLDVIREEYYVKLLNGEVAEENDDYGCNNIIVTQTGELKTVKQAASDAIDKNAQLGILDNEAACGAQKKKRRRRRFRGANQSARSKGYTSNIQKKRPLLKGAKMVDGRTKAGKLAKSLREGSTPRELAAQAAMSRFGPVESLESDGDSSLSDSEITPHQRTCACRCCSWERLSFQP